MELQKQNLIVVVEYWGKKWEMEGLADCEKMSWERVNKETEGLTEKKV